MLQQRAVVQRAPAEEDVSGARGRTERVRTRRRERDRRDRLAPFIAIRAAIRTKRHHRIAHKEEVERQILLNTVRDQLLNELHRLLHVEIFAVLHHAGEIVARRHADRQGHLPTIIIGGEIPRLALDFENRLRIVHPHGAAFGMRNFQIGTLFRLKVGQVHAVDQVAVRRSRAVIPFHPRDERVFRHHAPGRHHEVALEVIPGRLIGRANGLMYDIRELQVFGQGRHALLGHFAGNVIGAFGIRDGKTIVDCTRLLNLIGRTDPHRQRFRRLIRRAIAARTVREPPMERRIRQRGDTLVQQTRARCVEFSDLLAVARAVHAVLADRARRGQSTDFDQVRRARRAPADLVAVLNCRIADHGAGKVNVRLVVVKHWRFETAVLQRDRV